METLVYASFNKDEQIRLQSSSGGIFYTLASYILNKDGVVFGARFDDSWNVVHDYCEKIDDLHSFLGSKYVQSKIGDTYRQVKDFLLKDRFVLFCGTPCQIYGLKCYLNKDYDNLILVDFVCHGVPSTKVWKTYLEKNFTIDEISNISFRNKKNGWSLYSLEITQEKNSYSCIHKNNSYIKGFLAAMYLRPSCYHCKFKGSERSSDFTLGDLWGFDEFNLPDDFFDDKGISLVMVHSKKGKNLFEALETCRSVPVDISLAIKKNPMIEKSIRENKKRKKFYKNGIEEGINILEELLKPTILKKIQRKLKRIIKRGK